MLPAEELLAKVHELRHRVRAIANELLELARDESGRLDLVEADSARESALREAPDGVEQELVLGVVSYLLRIAARSAPNPVWQRSVVNARNGADDVIAVLGTHLLTGEEVHGGRWSSLGVRSWSSGSEEGDCDGRERARGRERRSRVEEEGGKAGSEWS